MNIAQIEEKLSILITRDEERLEYFFKLYEKMIQEEKDDRETLFQKVRKTRKKRK